MNKLLVTTCLIAACLAATPASAQAAEASVQEAGVFEDLAKVDAVDPEKHYRLGDSGICGLVREDHILVTHVLPGSPADGKAKVGDLVRGLQHFDLGEDIRATVAKRIYRLGRDWHWKLSVTVERPGPRGGDGNTFTILLRLPPAPGLLHHFGPTGFFAKIYPDHLLVESFAEGSPADGRLQVGDCILAVDGKPMTGDVFELFAQCIDKAETRQGGGILKLKVRRPAAETEAEAEVLTVELPLKVLGSYSRTAPLDCPKTDAIVTRTAQRLVRTGNMGRLNIGLLGLLATGERKYIDYVGKVLHSCAFAKPNMKLAPHSSYVNWPWSCQTITLCEYYLITGDKYVLPAIETYAVTIAEGQDAAGLWNHRMANPAANFGNMHGRLYGYGAINQPSVTLLIALILAEKCGVDHPEVRAAIEKSRKFYSNFIGKGALPYGNHGPLESTLNNNGTSASVAVAFSLLGDADGARFFSMLSAAGHDEILTGHTGPYFGILWSGLGANVAGPETSAAHARKIRWLRTLTRTWDDGFLYMESRGGRFSYSGLSSDGANLLNYCAGRRKLLITGKDADRSLWLTRQAAEELVAAATADDVTHDAKSLLTRLGSPLPRVRIEAAQLLAVNDCDVAAPVVRLLTSGTREEKIGACHAVRELEIVSAVEPLMALARDEQEDLWVREKAVDALAALGEPARAHVPELLRLLVTEKPYDVHGDFDRTIGFALSRSLIADPKAQGLDKDLFYDAANKLLDHKHHSGRTSGMSLLQHMPLEEFHRVADKMIYVIEDKDRTYTAYHGDEQRQIGLEILNRLNIQEAVGLTVDTIKEPTGRVGPRTRGRLRLLPEFGASAKPYIAQIRVVLGNQADEVIQAIEQSQATREMISLEEAKQAGLIGTVTEKRGETVLEQRTVDRAPGRLREPVDWVDCLIGTSTSRWMLYPGPSMPFGMVKLSPDNQGNDPARRHWKAGYEYTIENIMGFSHIHAWTMGGLLTMPVTGPLQTKPGPEHDPDSGYRSRFRHDTETAKPGYYAVTLDDYGIRAELTCTTRAGFQRYTFPESEEARILFDLLFPTEYGKKVLDARVVKISDTEIAGSVEMVSGLHYKAVHYQDYKLHFVARTNKAFDSMDGWCGEEVSLDVRELSGRGDTGVCLNFKTSHGEQILLKTGISLVSIDQARLNLDTEMKPYGWDFDACRDAARETWNELLSRVEVEGGREVNHLKFYTNMYRAYCARTIWSDANGKYTDMHERVQQLPDPSSPVYGCDAFWNTFWNLNQLWNLVTPDVSDKWVRSQLEMYDKGGWLAKGPTGIEYSSIMVASHEIPLMVAAYQHGIRGYDVKRAFEAMVHCQTTPGRKHPAGGHVGNKELTPYLEHGYIPIGKGSASNTLEYAYDDWCVAQMARALGREREFEQFSKRGQYWRNLFDRETGFMRARHPDGRWQEEFDPYDRAGGWVEGNPWQYTWFVPQNMPGLIELMGRARFVQRLNDGLEKSSLHDFNAPGDRMSTVPINHGNQPSMQVAYLFNHAGSPWLTQKWARSIMDQYYGDDPRDGWPGDEDQGQGGAWFVMSALGLFQTDGGCRVDPIYEIGSPLFDRAVVRLDPKYYKGGQFIIETSNNGPRNMYVQSATLSGKPLDKPWFYAREALGGGRLVLDMGPEPNKAWGARAKDAPPKP